MTVRNMAIVWLLTGIWHGASWNYALWGIYFGVLIICEKLFFGKWLEKIPKFFSWLYSFVAVVIGWVFFSYEDIMQAFQMLGAMFGIGTVPVDNQGLYCLMTFGPTLVIAALCSSPLAGKLTEKMRTGNTLSKVVWTVGYCALLVVSVCFLVDNSYNPFLYFQF